MSMFPIWMDLPASQEVDVHLVRARHDLQAAILSCGGIYCQVGC